jgi:hypothetical protein
MRGKELGVVALPELHFLKAFLHVVVLHHGLNVIEPIARLFDEASPLDEGGL